MHCIQAVSYTDSYRIKKKPCELEAEQFDVTLFRKVISTRIREKNIVFHAERKRNELQNRQQTRAMHDRESTYYFPENKRG